MVALSPHTIIRPEPDGALLFQQETAETALLDLEGLDALYFLLRGGLREYPVGFVRYLNERRFVVPGSSEDTLQKVERVRDVARQTMAPPRSLAVPETLHFSVTGRCDQACTGCFYSARPGSDVAAQDASWGLFERVVLAAEQAQVFQIALGGGEPLLHPRLVDMVRLAREHSIVPNLTTNGNFLTLEMAHELKKAGLGQAQISLNGAEEAVNAQTRPNFATTMQAIENCRAAGLRWGLNFLVTRSNVTALEAVMALGHSLGAASINILRPKPPTTQGDWLAKESLDGAGYRVVQRVLRQTARPPTRLTLDASLSFLLTDQSPDHLYRHGVWGCCAARKFVTITQDGAVLPCSHVRWSDAGEGDFMRAWWHSEVFARFRKQEETLRGPCRACSYLELCKGCRAVVMAFGGDFSDSDPHCPLRGTVHHPEPRPSLTLDPPCA